MVFRLLRLLLVLLSGSEGQKLVAGRMHSSFAAGGLEYLEGSNTGAENPERQDSLALG